MPRTVNLLVIHCSATQSGRSLARGKPGTPGYLSPAAAINAVHAAKGFARTRAACAAFNELLPSIGYHYVIDVTGEVYTGRHLDEPGEHAKSFNAGSVGVCMAGGIERIATYTPAQWRSLAEVVRLVRRECGIPLVPARRLFDKVPIGYRTSPGVLGHRDLSPDLSGNGLVEPHEWVKTCPGFSVAEWLANGMEPLAKHVYREPAA